MIFMNFRSCSNLLPGGELKVYAQSQQGNKGFRGAPRGDLGKMWEEEEAKKRREIGRERERERGREREREGEEEEAKKKGGGSATK